MHVPLKTADGTLEERSVKTGLANWEYKVLEGLAAGDLVVTSLEREVKAGAHVVTEEKEKPCERARQN